LPPGRDIAEQVHGIGFAVGSSLNSPFCRERAGIVAKNKLAKNEFGELTQIKSGCSGNVASERARESVRPMRQPITQGRRPVERTSSIAASFGDSK
jgi:hypothetical protein